jgi:hypothetical protein
VKKIKRKKLTLNRETLTELDRLDLRRADGGVTGPRACPFSGYNTCGTCQATCTTNFC